MAEKDATERRVYNLPLDLLERLRAFQVSHGIGSEAEAARRLLDTALQMRDTIDNILNTLEAKFVEEKDLRVLASEVLTKHALVSTVSINDLDVTFSLKTGDRGKLTSHGTLYFQDPDDHHENWREYSRKQTKPNVSASSPAKVPSRSVGGWDTRPSNLDDDEIPF